MRRFLIFLVAIWTWGGILASTRPDSPLTLTFEQCVDSALINNPALNAAAMEVEKARILQGTAFNPPMTEITLKQETTGGGGPENGVFFGQEFDFPSVYVARHRSLTARSELEASRFNLMMADLEKEIGQAYYGALHARELLSLNNELGDIYEEFCRVASIRLEEGDAGALELMNAERVREKNSMERYELELKYDACLTELMRLTGCSSMVEPAAETFQPISSESLPDYLDFNTTSRGIAAQRAVTLAEREIALAKNEFLPGIRVGATAQAFLKGFNPYHIDRQRFEPGNFMGIEVGITVPLFFSAQNARLKAAAAEKRISLLNLEASDAEARSLFATLGNRLLSLSSRLDYYRSSAIPRADEIKRIARVSYELGDIDYIEFIANLETAYGIYNDYADCVNEYNQCVITLKNLRK